MTQAFSKTELAQGHALFCNPALHTTNWRRKYPQFPAAVACRARSAWMHTSHKHTHTHIWESLIGAFIRAVLSAALLCEDPQARSVWVFMTEEKNRQTALDGIQTEILDKILGHFIIRHKLLYKYTVFLLSKLVALHSGIVFFPDDTWNAKNYSPSCHPWL